MPPPPPRRPRPGPAPRPAPPADARAGALALLRATLGQGQTLAEARSTADTPFSRLPPPDQARALRLALATLRNLDRADTTLSPHLRTPPPEPARTILRLAICECMVFDAPAHGVVNAAVALTRASRKGAGLAGLVNAVLRKATATPRSTWDTLPPQRLPAWLRKPLTRAWGKARVSAMEVAYLQGAPLDLTLRRPDQAAHWAAQLGAELLPTGSLRLPAGAQVTALPGYAQGAWWVQDAAAALPAQLLAPAPGARVLDLCAAPGGKTLQLAAMGADVTALDISAPRLERLHRNLARTGLRAQVATADALDWRPEAPFDAILLDAPCSASGTIRRHPDMPMARKPADLEALRSLQARLLDRALDPAQGLLRSGGRVVYCTCSLLPQEGEDQIAAALTRHPQIRLRTPSLPGVDPAWLHQGGLRTRPDHWAGRGGLDGFFMAVLDHCPDATTGA